MMNGRVPFAGLCRDLYGQVIIEHLRPLDLTGKKDDLKPAVAIPNRHGSAFAEEEKQNQTADRLNAMAEMLWEIREYTENMEDMERFSPSIFQIVP